MGDLANDSHDAPNPRTVGDLWETDQLRWPFMYKLLLSATIKVNETNKLKIQGLSGSVEVSGSIPLGSTILEPS